MKSVRKSNEEFILEAKQVHGEIYNYSLVDYKTNKTKIILICEKHGEFSQTPSDHLNGNGCKQCGFEKRKTAHQYKQEDILILFYKIHTNTYDYSLVDYKNSKEKVTIKCNKCSNDFSVTPNLHLRGSGCLICNVIGNVSEPKLFFKLKDEFKILNVIRQGKPIWLNKSKRSRQSLDIYFPDENIGVEYQGAQHFKSVGIFGGKEGFKWTQERDERKRLLCEENGCKLFYFTYKPKDVPVNWPHKVYTDEQELINEIKKYINENKIYNKLT